jgi:hypothetical protein
MKRLVVVCLLAALAVSAVTPAFAWWRAHAARRGPARTVVVVNRGFPIHRAMPTVVVHPARTAVMVTPGVFLAPVLWRAAIASLPPRDAMVWEDSETLSKEDNWTEFTLNVNDRGTKLYCEVKGWVQLNFAEVVFANGETQVVDFRETDRGSGVYSMLDFADGRKVSHVRMVARAKTEGSQVIMRMAK